MCLFFIVLVAGPRLGILFWWLAEPGRWDTAFGSFIWPFLGFLFLPWTTLMFVAVAPFGNVEGFDWFWLGLAVFADFASHAAEGYGNRNRIPGYSTY
jgi:hypothetical protein